MPDPRDAWPYFEGKFLVEIDGRPLGKFRMLTGLEVEVELNEIREGGQNQFVHVVPGTMRWPRLVLTEGITSDDALAKWLRETSGDGFAKAGEKLTRKTLAVTMLDDEGKPRRCWEVIEAFPVRWKGPDFDINGHDEATEVLEIAHHGFTTVER